ncbi:MAG: sulfotransferase [Alphaproteobacteria bacterium]|nr:sulfotransferase [Alphaproteobacteria bacterium]MCB9796123.1 sulfotransferase [Alphaproteobacteria bacterium]
MTTPQLALPYRLLNVGLGALSSLGLGRASLEPEALRAQAVAATGLDDFGPDEHLEPLEVLLSAAQADPRLSALGRIGLSRECVKMLSERLRVVKALAEHPEITAAPTPPIVILTGLPRTGSTFLHRLLGADPEALAPRFWELRATAPRDEPDDPAGRIAEAQVTAEQVHRMSPAMQAIHPIRPESPEEEYVLLQRSFSTCFYLHQYDIPAYREWLLAADMRPAYRLLRAQLQLLHWTRPGAWWALKSPFHLFHLAELMEVFPEATVVQLHRGLGPAAGSGASMVMATRAFTHGQVAPERAGQVWREMWSESAQRAMAARDALPDDRVLDLHQAELVADPIGALRRVREAAGLGCSEDLEAHSRAWMVARARRRAGMPKHRHTPADFGLDGDPLRESFADYMERYGVSLEV